MNESDNLNKTDEQPAKDEIKLYENNNLSETSGQPTKENPFKSRKFCMAYFATLASLCAIFWLLTGDISGMLTGALILCIPCVIVGLIIWAIVRIKMKSIALGILFGCITPFIVVFIVTGGCGLFMF